MAVRKKFRFRPAGVVCSLLFLLSALEIQGSPSDALALLETHCVRCHGDEKTKANFDLVTREALLRGGETGPSISLGKPDESLLIQLVRHEKDPVMPHKERKLAAEEISVLEKWVKEGAPYTRPLNKSPAKEKDSTFVISEKERNHWAFQAIKRPAVPKISDPKPQLKNPIDSFIAAKLKDAGLSFAPAASREQLIRRVSFDLIGLPPTPEEIDSFVKDLSPSAYEKLIDRLLASKHYGERWARHWLDLARYAETDGFEHDAVRPHSWRYRDYVINAFNSDKPYDRFIKEQLAGDELFPNDPVALTATGFNLLGPDMVDSSDQVQRRHNTLNDMTDTAGLAFLGLTIGCARCHDHKQEPISQRDYYSLQAFFASAKFEREKPIPIPEALAKYNDGMKKLAEHPKSLELAELEKPIRQKIFENKLSKLSPEAQMAHRTPAADRSAEQSNLVLETRDKVVITDKDLENGFSTEEKNRWKKLVGDVKKLPKPAPLPKAMTLAKGNPSKARILFRGDYNQPLDEVQPAVPEILSKSSFASRGELVEWLISKDNPLTARVMVNRIWKHHFGRGIVATPSDFGTRGTPPTHPKLLDWLATEFIEQGWSIKKMHKLMLMSATYQQSSTAPASSLDPENRLYGRMNRVRLEGEIIRDALLSISGKLNPAMGGPGVMPPIPKELFAGATGWNASTKPEDHTRRSIYIFARRNLRFPFLEVFDAPDNNLSCAMRESSTTAPQALTLLNADEVILAARATAERLRKEAGSREEQVTLAYRLVLGRKPAPKELELSRAFLQSSPLEEFCRALFNLNEFIYLE